MLALLWLLGAAISAAAVNRIEYINNRYDTVPRHVQPIEDRTLQKCLDNGDYHAFCVAKASADKFNDCIDPLKQFPDEIAQHVSDQANIRAVLSQQCSLATKLIPGCIAALEADLSPCLNRTDLEGLRLLLRMIHEVWDRDCKDEGREMADEFYFYQQEGMNPCSTNHSLQVNNCGLHFRPSTKAWKQQPKFALTWIRVLMGRGCSAYVTVRDCMRQSLVQCRVAPELARLLRHMDIVVEVLPPCSAARDHSPPPEGALPVLLATLLLTAACW